MTLAEFKQKYFTNNFYWVDEANYELLQRIGIEMDCLNPSREPEIIQWHTGFKNLGFRTRDGRTKFQKEPFLLHNETATSYEQMLSDYTNIQSTVL